MLGGENSDGLSNHIKGNQGKVKINWRICDGPPHQAKLSTASFVLHGLVYVEVRLGLAFAKFQSADIKMLQSRNAQWRINLANLVNRL